MRRIPGAVLFLAGPVIWFAQFMVVYLFAEAGCNPGGLRVEPLVVTWFTVVVTVVAAVATTTLAVRAARSLGDQSDGDRRFMRWVGAILGGLFVLAILLVGAPALVFPPC